ncbi:T9SS type A sorting domain-containing protein [Candidatus Poribacteria bacterium]|nr:T9SS type A sorting domain-containing protein [Candidatus Poribacteria bacterium]
MLYLILKFLSSITKNNGLIEVLPAKTALLANYPNPFNPETWIPYQLSAESDVTVEVYDIHGRLVRRFVLGMQRAGSYITKDRAVYWNGKNESGERVASGVYFYRLKAEHPEAEFSAVRRLVVVK